MVYRLCITPKHKSKTLHPILRALLYLTKVRFRLSMKANLGDHVVTFRRPRMLSAIEKKGAEVEMMWFG